MSLSERNTPSHGAGAGSGSAAGRQRAPPDVEEALSSMLWTPYERTPMPSSSEGEEEGEEDDDERLNRKLHKSHSSYEASALNQPPIYPHAHSSHLHPIYAHQPPAVEPVPLLLPLPLQLPLPLPPVPSFPNFSLSAFDAAIAGFDLDKAGQSATAEGSGAGGGRGGRRNRYSYPSYYGSPAHTLTQWCSSAATAIQEPPSYESLYSAQGSTSLLAMSSVARPRSGSQPETEPCDRSQRSPKKAAAAAAAPLTANVPAERLMRSFTDDYISQNCASFTPAIKQSSNKRDTELTKATEIRQRQKQSPATNARSQQSREKTSSSSIDKSNNNNDSDCSSSSGGANCIINEQRRGKADDEHEMAKAAAPTTTTTGIEETNSRAGRQVTQPVSCATATGEREQLERREPERARESDSNSHSHERSAINNERPTITRSTKFNAFTTTGSSSSSGTSNYSLSSASYKNSSDGSVLRPNKCLAELERLYAEFRASESRFERGVRRQSDFDNANVEMRLNVPANAVATPQTAAANANTNPNAGGSSSSSSVFLNAPTSSSNNNHIESPVEQSVSTIAVLSASTATATATARSCQRQPSLTIQVNNNNNNNNNNGTNSSRVSVASSSSPTSSIVNNNNGVCVVEINNSVPAAANAATAAAAAKVFSATSVQNQLNNNTCPTVDKQHVATPQAAAAASSSSSSSNSNNHVNDNSVNIINVNATTVATAPRTFTSTECQTDDLAASPSSQQQQQQQQQMRTREQRRRERRERRQQQQQQQQFPPHHPRRHHAPPPPPPPQLHPPPHLHHPHPAAMGLARALLPDILHPHYPPPYSALPVPVPITVVPPPSQQPPPQQPPPPPPLPPSVPPAMLTSVISTVPLPGPGPAGPPLMSDGRFTLPLPIMRRSPSERSGKGCCGQWFAGPPLRALIAVVALGGVACALGGAALGATGLAGPPNSHLTAALLMIGVGVVLVTVSGAAWRMTAPGGQSCLGLGLGTSVDLGRCGRRPCSRGGGAPHGLLYPEFQHRPPPPSYQASMQEYRLRLLLLDRDRQNGVVRGNSPPPTYRSHAGSLLRAPLTTLRSGMGVGGGGGGAGGTISSSMGGSEYSLPPSYRSRNATPASFVCGERSIETAPSGRLLANEDLHLPEPSLAEQLTNYTALQSNTLLTSAIVEIERDASATPPSPPTTAKATSTATKGKDLVTIVTISQADSDSPHLHTQRHSAGKTTHSQTQTQTQTHTQSPGQASALDQIDILAHL
ncbi:ataxin-2 homolog [Drosophila obscura]|uniref:ataxin-2 homolog n=1 Tax=Drosophila obscura TaxID=7282 RepID=UPI001BB13083|nr:ataxin-2 homolog [Drosophila obscura]